MHVFISYSHEDLDFAQNVKHELERRRIPVWIDELTPAGDDWRQDIEEALRRAYSLVLIITPDAMESQYVTYEWAFALGRRCRWCRCCARRATFTPA
ncbi:MAG: toll/interleukin-1 receptor domain-containing protein [Chloroflexi bacterium]|nr:toll/interleukin-1 receptor domain-containing protein [Chloroflexota bacterium]